MPLKATQFPDQLNSAFAERGHEHLSTSAVVPKMAGLAAGQGATPAEDGSHDQSQMLAAGIEMHFARGSHERMPPKDDGTLALFARQPLQSFAQIQLLAGEKLVVEAANLAKSGRLAKNKGAGGVFRNAADGVPEAAHHFGHETGIAFHFYNAAAA
ncbi:MAG TPA: hypothetical protein VH598_03895 [Verrucomicrobiae bacterium]|nr:hypothetical protein [Verrucomicrobiae bacterium]